MNSPIELSAYEMSKTYQYRKVMKPLLERKRRARINKCLDDLKELIAESLQQQNNDINVKLEKADILELAVKHIRSVRNQNRTTPILDQTPAANVYGSFRSGYIHAANEVSRCLAFSPNVDVALGTKLMTHLGLRLNEIQNHHQYHQSTSVTKPLKICCTLDSGATSKSECSPSSSGYGSDNDSACSSPCFLTHGDGLLKISTSHVWRPW